MGTFGRRPKLKRETLCLCAIALYFVFFFHQTPQPLVATDASTEFSLPNGFTFYPSNSEKPLKSRAVMTLLISGPLDSHQIDAYGLATFVQIFNYIHNEKTKLSTESDAEFIVMITSQVPQHYRSMFLLLGARLLEVPKVEVRDIQDGRYDGTFTKIHMWQLEDVFTSIVYVDLDLFIWNDNIEPLWNSLIKDSNGSELFAACPDQMAPKFGPFNSGLMIFKPSVQHYNVMKKLSELSEYNWYADQTLFGKYFVDDLKLYKPLPQHYNVMFFSNFSETPVGYHIKYWRRSNSCVLPVDQSMPGFQNWRDALRGIRKLQERLQKGSSLPIVPIVPSSFDSWIEQFIAY
ncbi:nucleotide-diphospho-sugar transferase [Obelidium mucronatum]|nr:nucleotide-diphospho-sugar transferase [Obelidium mucronatum]